VQRSWLRELRVAAETFDWPAVTAVTDGYVEHLWRSASTPALSEVREILQMLRAHLRYDELRRVADAALGAGLEDAAVRRQYAQALVDDDKPAFALHLFRGILADPDLPGPEQIEARGGIGRCHKQLFMRTRDAARRAAHLGDALNAYRSAYLEDDQRFWHGINTVALLLRAARDDPDLHDDTRAAIRKDATELAERVFTTVDHAEPSTAWTRAVACEALIALDRFDEAVQRAMALIEAPDTGAFTLASFLRQLVEVWQLSTAEPPGEQLLPVLRSALLERNGGSVHVSTRDVRETRLAALTSERLEKVLGSTRFQSLTWYRNGLARCRAVARIANANDDPVGTGFLIAGRDLHPALPPLVLLTNGHVVPESLPAADAVVTFHGIDADGPRRTFRVQRVWWYEPSHHPGLDTTVLELDAYPEAVAPVPVARCLPTTDASARAYVIGHPHGLTQPQFSLQDNLLLGHDDRVVHYRSPTEPGSSGSPVFDHQWNLIALHHSGSFALPRLNNAGGAYPANEGIAIRAICNRLRERTPTPSPTC
jgi:hypothetical protein